MLGAWVKCWWRRHDTSRTGSAGRVSAKSNRTQGNAVGEEPEHEPLRHREAPVPPPGAPWRPVASLRVLHATLGLSPCACTSCRHPEMACHVRLLRVGEHHCGTCKGQGTSLSLSSQETHQRQNVHLIVRQPQSGVPLHMGVSVLRLQAQTLYRLEGSSIMGLALCHCSSAEAYWCLEWNLTPAQRQDVTKRRLPNGKCHCIPTHLYGCWFNSIARTRPKAGGHA